MKNVIDQLAAAQRELAGRSVADILKVLDRVTARWLDPADPIRQTAEAKLAETTGLAPLMIRRGLTDMIRRVQGMGDVLDADLGTREALDGFFWRAPGVLSRAWGPGLLTCVFSGNVPGLPAFDMAMGLALKSAVLVRPPTEEPAFPGLFAQSVAEEDAVMGRCLAIVRWGKDETWPYEQAGAVLVYGSDSTVAAVRSKVPSPVRFLGHGHKISFAVIAREAATADTAALLAHDVTMYDQQGCVSPHMAFVERGGQLTPQAFAQQVGVELARLATQMPRRRLTSEEAFSARLAREEAEFAADASWGSPGDLSWAVIHSETPQFMPSPLNRLLRTFAVSSIGDVPAVVARYSQYLQTAAFAGSEERREQAAEALGRVGISRVCPVGRVQEPSALWRHDGSPTAGSLVRWTDIEE
ncbi:MAG TPA: acyl-CoA reductase [Symbiobacteriaceae bacterium]|nr:acyl-CoA reductase [Symbiobacteriaceae bacterium]